MSLDRKNDMRPFTAARLGLIALLLAPSSMTASLAMAHSIYETTRVVQPQGVACVGVKACKVVTVHRKRIPSGTELGMNAKCPAERPYLVNWDAARHEHIGVKVVKRGANKLTVLAANHADAPGSVTLYLGCSPNAVKASARLMAMEAIPSKALLTLR
jgi:hypothetical protein